MDINLNKKIYNKRDLESLRVLKRLGVLKKNIFIVENYQLIIINYIKN